MKRRFVMLIALALALVMTASFAFALSADGADKADIEQRIYERRSKSRSWSALKPVTEEQPLFPAVGEAELTGIRWWLNQGVNKTDKIYGPALKNELDRFVFVENMGSVSVYVRTWFAFEEGAYGKSVLDELIHINFNSDAWTMSEITDGVEIDGNKFTVFYADYKETLAPGDTAEPSLMQLYMDSSGTNEDIIAIDGNGSGKYEIGIVSQAVDATDFDDGADALNNVFDTHPWTNGLTID